MIETGIKLICLTAILMSQISGSQSTCRISRQQVSDLLESDSEDSPPTVQFTGRYRLVNSSCFDEFLQELGIGFFRRNIARSLTPDYEITLNGDEYTLKTLSSFRDSKFVFKLNGEQFDEQRIDGVVAKSTVIARGNKWIQKQLSDKEVTIVREFTENSIKVTAIVNNIASVRVYNRIN